MTQVDDSASETKFMQATSMMIADIHTHPLLNMVYLGKDLSLRRRPPRFYNPLRNQVDLARAWSAGVNVLGFTIYVPFRFPWKSHWDVTLASLGKLREFADHNASRLSYVKNADDLDDALDENVIAGFPCVEGGHVIGSDLGKIETLADAGVWYMTLVHFFHNRIGPTCLTDAKGRKGLTPFGRDVVKELEHQGICPDLAHMSERAFWEVMELTSGPVLYTHGGARSLCDTPRNLRDDQLEAIAESGGCIGLILFPKYLKKGRLRGNIDLVLDHAEHIASVVGEDHVCIGSDLDGYITTVDPIRDITGLPILVQRMKERFGEEFARKVAGENVIRTMRQHWGE